ncbi:hypothetical protein [Halomicronema sp. CCY15110]|uniref:hypothetical protein n=1 Tax=Halomicronema sp. CCY15110 TaxID=2767773 RepID=UPI00194E1442|nr:hypothetical protein [Halomicronema sp. CCY15110]
MFKERANTFEGFYLGGFSLIFHNALARANKYKTPWLSGSYCGLRQTNGAAMAIAA